MVVEMQHIQRGLGEYIEAEIAAKSEGVQKFAVYFMTPQIIKSLTQKFEELRQNPMFADFFVPEGVELDKVREQASAAMQKAGHVEMFGLSLGQSDVDKLYNYIRRSAGV